MTSLKEQCAQRKLERDNTDLQDFRRLYRENERLKKRLAKALSCPKHQECKQRLKEALEEIEMKQRVIDGLQNRLNRIVKE